MGQTDVSRLRTYEEQNTFISPSLDELIREVDARLTGSNCYPVITRVADLISKIEYFADIAHTQKRIERSFSRTTGSDGVEYITGMITIFYNDNGSEDSRITTTIYRTDDLITHCDNVFSTGESLC